jgi:hypothetical protein
VEGNPSRHANEKAALVALLKAVPPEMVGALAMKGTAKSAWEAIKTMRLGTDRVRQATLQRLWKDFEQITFHANETLNAFGMRITSLVNNLRSLGDTVEEVRIVRKILRVVPKDYSQMACSIETLLDLNAMSVEELIGRLRSSEGRGSDTPAQGANGTLLLTEEEWEARRRQKEQGQGSGGGGHGRKKGKPKPKNGNDRTGERDMSKVKCYNCNNLGHFSKQCTEPRRERKQQANLAQGQEEEQSLLLTSLCALTVTTECTSPEQHVLLNEERSKAKAGNTDGACDTAWFLDTGASNHMCGRREFFTKLDTGVRGSVKLGDDTSVEIEGRGSILFQCRNGEHLALEQVYLIPRLRSNIVSLGQLDEVGFDTHIRHGLLRLRDADRRLVARVQRNRVRLYVLYLDLAQPV